MPISSSAATTNGSIGRGRSPTESTYTLRPCRYFITASAIGERIALWVQAKSTLPGSSSTGLTTDVQHAEKGEQPPRGLAVDRDLVGQRIRQLLGALVVQAAASHVDRLDPARRGALDCLEVAVADQEVILDDAPERPHREGDL